MRPWACGYWGQLKSRRLAHPTPGRLGPPWKSKTSPRRCYSGKRSNPETINIDISCPSHGSDTNHRKTRQRQRCFFSGLPQAQFYHDLFGGRDLSKAKCLEMDACIGQAPIIIFLGSLDLERRMVQLPINWRVGLVV